MITATAAENAALFGSGGNGDGAIVTSNARNGVGSRILTRVFAGDTAGRSVVIEKKSDAGAFDLLRLNGAVRSEHGTGQYVIWEIAR